MCVRSSIQSAVDSIAALDLSQLRFAFPKDSSTSEKACTSRAYMLPGKGAFRIALMSATVDRVTHARQDFHTLFVRMPPLAFSSPATTTGKSKGKSNSNSKIRSKDPSDLKKFADALDLRVLEVAKANISDWFKRAMNGDLVEEYYRGSTTTAPAVRFVLAGATLPDALEEGKIVDAVLQLVSLEFRTQYFTCVWKVVSASPAVSPSNEEEEEDDDDETHDAGRLVGGGFGFFPDDEEDPTYGDEEDEDEDAGGGPLSEDRKEIREALVARLSTLEAAWASQAEAARAKADRFKAAITTLATEDDLAALASVDALLDQEEVDTAELR